MQNLLVHFCIYLTHLPFGHSYRTDSSHCNPWNNLGTYKIDPKVGFKQGHVCGKGKKSELIIGGEVEDPPDIVKNVQTEESKEFADKCWKNKLSINEALGIINSEPERVEDSVIDNILYDNNLKEQNSKNEEKDNPTSHETRKEEKEEEQIGTVELDPIFEEEDELEESLEEDLEVDFGELSDSELSVILSFMEERLNNKNNEYKSKMLETLTKDNTLSSKNKDVKKEVEKLYRISDLFLKLNSNMYKNPLDLEWIPKLETKIYRFLKTRNYTLARPTWTEDSLILILKEKNLSEKQISKIHDEVQEYMSNLSRSQSFRGLSNIGLLVSGEDP